MRYSTLLMIILTAMVTQSCKITMPSLILLNGDYEPYAPGNPSAYRFDISRALKAQSGFKDTLILGDWPNTRHAIDMQTIFTSMRIPEKNIVLFEDFGYIRDGNIGLRLLVSGDHEKLRKATRVVALPLSTPLSRPADVPRVMSTDILFVLAAGNTFSSFKGDRDMYNSNHVRWSHQDPEIERIRKIHYQAILDVYNTGKVIAATSARVTEAGEVEPYKYVFQCGDIKESCYTIIPGQSTSRASARLAAMSFYLAQFYETPEAIIDVLQECAIDIGEPGVDREYGRGIANLLCPRVLDKELEIVGRHMEQEEKRELPQGGDLVGIWKAEETALQVYIPQVLRETVQTNYTGTTNGTITFTETTVSANFSVSADIEAVFLLSIAAKATDEIKTEGIYQVDQENRITLPGEQSFTYRATEDSLHITRYLSLTDALRLLPGHFGSMAEHYGKELLKDDPLAISMRFKRVSPPGIPGNVRETSSTDSTLTLAWETPQETEGLDIERYRITQYTDNTCTTVVKITETTEQTLQFTNLTDNTTYYFTVEAKTAAGWGTPSHCLVVKTERKVSPPGIPGNVRETSSTDSTLTLAWETPQETEGLDIERYRITQYTDNTCTTVVKITETTEQTLQFTNLTDNTTYYFTVEAKTAAGWGTPSHCLVVKTERKVSPPGIPGNVRETSSTDSTLTLAWETPQETEGLDIERYRITQYTDNTCTTVVKITETTEQTLQFTNLTDNTTYYFTVEAKTTAGWGMPSHCLVATTEQKRIPGDFDNNQVVDFADFLLFTNAFGSVRGDAAFNERMDLMPDGMINFADFLIFVNQFGKTRDS